MPQPSIQIIGQIVGRVSLGCGDVLPNLAQSRSCNRGELINCFYSVQALPAHGVQRSVFAQQEVFRQVEQFCGFGGWPCRRVLR